MTIIEPGIAAIVARLLATPDTPSRLMLFGAIVGELGGLIQFPAPAGNWGPHVVELSLLGITGAGDTADEALANWIACARRLVENPAAVARAELLLRAEARAT